MRLRSVLILGSVAIMLTLTMGADVDCDDIFASSLLDGLWFAAGAATSQLAADGSTGDGDQAGQTIPGEPGEQGEQGVPGEEGAAGESGADGLSCWDLNGNGVADPAEDVNGDGDFNALDCQGADGVDGQPGEAGEPGLSCWDLNGNGVGETEEDINGDGNLDALDCQGAAGEPAQFQVIASAVIRDNGTTQSGNNVLSSVWFGSGFYQVVFDVSEAEIPDGADAIDFPVLVTILDEVERGPDFIVVARYTPVSLEDGELKIQVHIYGPLPLSLSLDSWFSIEVLEPGVPFDDPNDPGS
jgi:hypothetical protein